MTNANENKLSFDLSGCAELKLLEQSYYKSDADSSLIAFMLNNNYSVDSDAFKEYHDRYVEQHTVMNLLKEKIYRQYVPEEIQEKAIRYQYDFESKEIWVYLR